MKDYIQKIINAFTSVKHSKEVTKEVHQWLLDEEYTDEKEAALNTLWQETAGQVDAGTWTSLEKVYSKVGVSADTKKQHRLFPWKYVAAVAMFAVTVSGTFWLTKNTFKEKTVTMIEQYIPDGKTNEFELPDGSRVHVNSGTLLLYPNAFKGDTRTVYLIGEADFKVKKNPDKPFVVRSANMSVTALGTEFNVSAYPEDSEIVATLIQGKVRVDYEQSDSSYILKPGQQVVYNRKTAQSNITDADLGYVTAWQRGQIVFRGSTMEEILQTLERRFDITFQYNMNLFTNDKYNFSFSKNADVGEVMEVMKEVTGKFTYKIDKNICYMKTMK